MRPSPTFNRIRFWPWIVGRKKRLDMNMDHFCWNTMDNCNAFQALSVKIEVPQSLSREFTDFVVRTFLKGNRRFGKVIEDAVEDSFKRSSESLLHESDLQNAKNWPFQIRETENQSNVPDFHERKCGERVFEFILLQFERNPTRSVFARCQYFGHGSRYEKKLPPQMFYEGPSVLYGRTFSAMVNLQLV